MARQQSRKILAARKEIRERIALMQKGLGRRKPPKQIEICCAICELDRIERELAGVYWTRTCPK